MATLALVTWPVLALILFSRLPVPQALIWTVLLPYLYLPEAYRIPLPGLPDLDKSTAISFGLVLCFLFFRTNIQNASADLQAKVQIPVLNKILFLCALGSFCGMFLTTMNNREPLIYNFTFETIFLPGARPWDAISQIGDLALLLFPFWISIRYLASTKAHRSLLISFVVAGLAYSVLALIEITLSPQLHRWIYGFHQHSFLQHIREGFRPMIFMQHGLWVGFFFFMALISAAALWKKNQDKIWLFSGIWIFFILFLSRNLAAFTIGVLALGTFFFFRYRIQRLLVLVIALATLFFPILRQSQLVPTGQIVNWAEIISADRAQSFEFRLNNEDILLAHAWEKPWTGWGGWGRNLQYNQWGLVETIPDGYWIIKIGTAGWIGYITFFGLLVLPIVFFAVYRFSSEVRTETLALALIAAGNLIYMIPNATLTPIGLLVFGALAGSVLYGEKDLFESSKSAAVITQPQSRYTRFRRSLPIINE